MKKAICGMAVILLVIGCLTFALVGCNKNQFSTAMPDFSAPEWSEMLNTDFRGLETLDGTPWAPMSPHGFRKYEYWCSDMIEYGDDGLTIKSVKTDNHSCSRGICPQSGIFTGGIETRAQKTTTDADGNEVTTFEYPFEQTFGYYEATVKVPRGTGMWSAFWLQSDNIGNIGHGGKDGAEIDIYESSFIRFNPTKTGSCIHYDAYNPPYYTWPGKTTDVGYNLYDGEFHTYSLLWTPEKYVFFVDGKETWQTGGDRVSLTPEYMKLTVEIRDTVYGPYGQKIGTFENHDDDTNDFVIQSVKVYQNENYLPYQKSKSEFDNKKSLFDNLIITFSVFGGVAICLVVYGVARYFVKKRKAI